MQHTHRYYDLPDCRHIRTHNADELFRSMVRPDTEAVRDSVLSPVACTVPFSPWPCSVFQMPCLMYGRRGKHVILTRTSLENFVRSRLLRTTFGATSYDVRGYFV